MKWLFLFITVLFTFGLVYDAVQRRGWKKKAVLAGRCRAHRSTDPYHCLTCEDCWRP